MSFQIIKVSNVTPASADFNFSDANLNADFEITQWISLAYWVDVADVTAGSFVAQIEYVDPRGQTQTIEGSPVSLADDTSFFQIFGVAQRQSDTSTLKVNTTLIGPAGTSKVSMRVRFSGECYSDGGITDWDMT